MSHLRYIIKIQREPTRVGTNWARIGHEQNLGGIMSNTKRLKDGVRLLKSGKYQVRYTDPKSTRRSGGTFSTLALAERALRRIVVEIETGTWIDPAQSSALNGRTTLREVAEQFRNTRRNRQGRPLAPNTLHEYERYIEVVVPHLANKPINEITEFDIERWWSVDSRKSPTQTSHAYSHLKSVFSYARKKKLIRENPCDIEGASKFIPEKQPEIPTREQVEIFLNSSSPEYSLIISLASMGGLRKNEILNLTRADIIETREDGETYYQVDINKGLSWVGGEIISRVPKTQKSIRVIPLPQAINHLLAQHLTKVGIHPEALLFPRNPSTPELYFTEHQLQRTWEKIRAVAGYRGSFHSLRAYALTRFAQLGATNQEIMDRGGHTDIRVAMKYQRSTGRERELISNW